MILTLTLILKKSKREHIIYYERKEDKMGIYWLRGSNQT